MSCLGFEQLKTFTAVAFSRECDKLVHTSSTLEGAVGSCDSLLTLCEGGGAVAALAGVTRLRPAWTRTRTRTRTRDQGPAAEVGRSEDRAQVRCGATAVWQQIVTSHEAPVTHRPQQATTTTSQQYGELLVASASASSLDSERAPLPPTPPLPCAYLPPAAVGAAVTR